MEGSSIWVEKDRTVVEWYPEDHVSISYIYQRKVKNEKKSKVLEEDISFRWGRLSKVSQENPSSKENIDVFDEVNI